MKKIFLFIFGLLSLCAMGVLWLWTGVSIPPPIQSEPIQCQGDAPPLDLNTAFKVLSFNVQYMASKNYIFFYDIENGPDLRPSLKDVQWTIKRVSEIIAAEDPDIVLLQEVTDNDARSHRVDQVKALQSHLDKPYPCVTNADYMRIRFMPHRAFMGPAGLKLAVLSKHPILQATRFQLPLVKNDPITEHFYFRRAVLKVDIETQAQQPNLTVFNTHFSAWAQKTQIMTKQINALLSLIEKQEALALPWIVGGDFNLLPPDGGIQYQKITRANTGNYSAETQLSPLYERFNAIPPLAELKGSEAEKWYTHFPNNPAVDKPDRTIDYIFSSNRLTIKDAYIRRHDTLDISDHLPVIGVFRYP